MSALKKTILGALGGRMLAQARIETVEEVSDDYRLITVLSKGFMGAASRPVAKMKIDAGALEMRTYTPLSIDTVTGRFEILVFIHGSGPGSAWAKMAKPGERTRTGGPKSSLDPRGDAVFFGDETSFAAASSLQNYYGTSQQTHSVFEVASTTSAEIVVDRLKLRDAVIIERANDAGHGDQIASKLLTEMHALATDQLILTGSGASIQRIRSAFRARAVSGINYKVKAYWMLGKTGLD